MAAALTLGKRGHHVVVFETAPQVRGQTVQLSF